jgi:hypothetical protein
MIGHSSVFFFLFDYSNDDYLVAQWFKVLNSYSCALEVDARKTEIFVGILARGYYVV